MKKYIRTKNGIFEVVSEDDEWVYIITNFERNPEWQCCIKKKGVIKEGGTIEELCDWFIVEGDDNEFSHHKTLLGAVINGKDYILETNETYTIYGSILFKGVGLIYVAKMNKKGELELL